MTNKTLAFIGGGNMARSLIGGLLAQGHTPECIIVSDTSKETLADLAARFPVRTTTDNRAAADAADVVVLAVKPQVLKPVAEELAGHLDDKLVISVAAGIRIDSLVAWLGNHPAVVRCMPNTPSLVQSGATGLFAAPGVSEAQHDLAESILRAVGLTLWVEREELMDAVTALSGSGPAYFFLVMEALQAAGEKLGLPAETARLLTLETAFGAAKMALESTEVPASLRARVTSPGGTTERGIAALEAAGLRQAFEQALQDARQRSEELADMLAKQ